MRKSRLFISVIALVLLSILFFHHYRIEGLDQLQLERRDNPLVQAEASLPHSPHNSIRIATFNLQVFGRTKSGQLETMQSLARIGRQFDLIALQEICGPGEDAVALLALNYLPIDRNDFLLCWWCDFSNVFILRWEVQAYTFH